MVGEIKLLPEIKNKITPSNMSMLMYTQERGRDGEREGGRERRRGKGGERKREREITQKNSVDLQLKLFSAGTRRASFLLVV